MLAPLEKQSLTAILIKKSNLSNYFIKKQLCPFSNGAKSGKILYMSNENKLNTGAKKAFFEGVVYFATCNQNRPNVTITQSGVVLANDEILICDCSMTQAKNNILKNTFCSLAVYDAENEVGYKIFGKGKYYKNGEYFDQAKKRLKSEPYKPKGAIVIKISKFIEIK